MWAARCVRVVYAALVCARRPGRPTYVHVRAPLQLQDPPNRLPTRLLDTNTNPRDTDSNTERDFSVRIVRAGTPPSVRPSVRSSVLLRSSSLPSLTSTFLFFPVFPYLSFVSFARRSHLLATGICTIIKPRLLPRLHTHRPGGACQWTAGKPIGIS